MNPGDVSPEIQRFALRCILALSESRRSAQDGLLAAQEDFLENASTRVSSAGRPAPPAVNPPHGYTNVYGNVYHASATAPAPDRDTSCPAPDRQRRDRAAARRSTAVDLVTTGRGNSWTCDDCAWVNDNSNLVCNSPTCVRWRIRRRNPSTIPVPSLPQPARGRSNTGEPVPQSLRGKRDVVPTIAYQSRLGRNSAGSYHPQQPSYGRSSTGPTASQH